MENKEITPWSPLRRFFRLLELDRKDIYYIYIYAIFSGIIALSLPLGIQAIIGLIAGGALSASIYVLIAIITVATALNGLLKVMQITLTEHIQRRIFVRSAFDFAYRIPRLRLDKIVSQHPPELVNRFFDTLTLQKGLPKILIDLSTAVLQIFFGLLLISFYHPFFISFGLFLIVLLGLIFVLTGQKGLRTSLKESKYKYEVAYWLEELARTMSTFKLAGTNQRSLQQTDDLVCHYLQERKSHFRVLLGQYGWIVAFKVIITGSLLLLGSYLVIENRINIGQFVAAEIIIILVINSVEKLILSMETIYDVLTALEKVGFVTDLPLEDDNGLEVIVEPGKGMALQMDNVSFKFPDTNRFALQNFSLKLDPGEKVAIAGYSGAGKSTLLQLVAGLHVDFTGSLTYNNMPFNSLKLENLRKNMGDYSAEEEIFRGSVVENITLGHPEITIDRVVEVAACTGLDKYIYKLKDGYKTKLLPGGKNIPRHVRTKILLSRCIVARPSLITIEANFAGLDAKESSFYIDILTSDSEPWTLLAVTDDPKLAARCDRVIIMQDGQIVASGTFDEIRKSAHFGKVFPSTDLSLGKVA